MGGYLSGGIEDAGALEDQQRKNAAYNAFSQSYGPGAAYAIVDPQAALGAQEAGQRTLTNPIDVQQKQASLDQTQLANDATRRQQAQMAAYRGAALLASTAQPDGSIPADAYDKIARSNPQVWKDLGVDPSYVDQLGAKVTQPGGIQELHSFMQTMIGPTKMTGAFIPGTDAQGNSILYGRDQFGNVITQPLGGGTTVQNIRANTGVQNADERGRHNLVTEGQGNTRLAIGQQNANTNAYRANTTANNSLFGNPGGFTGAGNGPASASLARGGAQHASGAGGGSADAAAAAPQVDPNSLFAKLPPKGKQEAIGQATNIVNAGTQLQNTNKIIGTVMQQISPYTAGTGSLLKDLPGSAQADLKANLKTLGAQGLTAWIQSMKNAKGQTGIGRVLQSEANAAMTLFGNMEQDQSAKQLAFHAQLFQQTVNRLYEHSTQGFQSMYGVPPHVAAGTDDPMAPKAATPQFTPQQIVDELRRRGAVK